MNPPGKPPPARHDRGAPRLRLEKRKPGDDDRPPVSTFPGPKRKPLLGEMALEETIDDAA